MVNKLFSLTDCKRFSLQVFLWSPLSLSTQFYTITWFFHPHSKPIGGIVVFMHKYCYNKRELDAVLFLKDSRTFSKMSPESVWFRWVCNVHMIRTGHCSFSSVKFVALLFISASKPEVSDEFLKSNGKLNMWRLFHLGCSFISKNVTFCRLLNHCLSDLVGIVVWYSILRSEDCVFEINCYFQ